MKNLAVKIVLGTLLIAQGAAYACDPAEGAAPGSPLLEAELVVQSGRFRLVSDPRGRAIVFREPAGAGEIELWRGLGTDYAETTMFALAPDLVVVEDHLFETDEGEPIYLWTLVTPRARLGLVESVSRPVSRLVEGGIAIDTVAGDKRISWTFCQEGERLIEGAVSCRQ
jgi:hypothetical protein